MSEFDTYAAGTITPVLSRALADLYQQEHGSVEPVEYLSNWLKLWAEAQGNIESSDIAPWRLICSLQSPNRNVK